MFDHLPAMCSICSRIKILPAWYHVQYLTSPTPPITRQISPAQSDYICRRLQWPGWESSRNQPNRTASINNNYPYNPLVYAIDFRASSADRRTDSAIFGWIRSPSSVQSNGGGACEAFAIEHRFIRRSALVVRVLSERIPSGRLNPNANIFTRPPFKWQLTQNIN